MCLECLELAGEHLVVGVAADQDNVVELTIESQFICVKGEPGVHALLDHSAFRVGAKMFVMEYDIILNQHILELPFVEQKIPGLCVSSLVASSVVVTFGYIQMPPVNAVIFSYLSADEIQQLFKIDFPVVAEAFIYLCIITSIDEYADGIVCFISIYRMLNVTDSSVRIS